MGITNGENSVKTFVIDTNVFIHRHDAVMSFRDNEVVIPMPVLEELDKLKSGRDERGYNARQAIRFLDSIGSKGNLKEGVKLDNGSVLWVELGYARDNVDIELQKTDNRILLTAYYLQKQGKRVFFVSKDINCRIKAMALGIKTVDYEKQKVNINQLYQGCIEIDVSEDTFNKAKSDRFVDWNSNLIENEYVILKEVKSAKTMLSRFRRVPDKDSGGILDCVSPVVSVSGIKPLNIKQAIALDLLLDESLSIVTLVGKAGTGKTLLAIAAGLKKVLDDKEYSRVLVARPIMPMGKDIGYLPGAKGEKLSHWMQPLFDNLEYILSVNKKQNTRTADQLISGKLIELEALTYIRGRSLPEQFIIIDEAQNLSPHEIKTIVSRAGAKTKVILTGDPYQIDSPYLDSNSNGLTYLVEAFKGQKIFGHIVLDRTERSELAELAAELL